MAEATTTADTTPTAATTGTTTTAPAADTTATTQAQTATTQGQTTTANATTTATTAADWRASLKSDEAREFAKTSPDIEHVISRALALQKTVSGAIIKPGKDAKPEQVAAYRKALDIPDEPLGEKGYQFAKPEFMSDEAFKSEAVQSVVGAVAKAMHEAGASRQVVQTAWNMWAQLEGASMQQAVAADKKFAEEAEAKLRHELGSEEALIAHKEFGRRAVTHMAKMAGVDAEALLKIETKDGRFVMDHPVMVKVWGKLGKEMGESTLGPVNTANDVAALDTQIRDIRAKISEAQAKGDKSEAQRLYEQEMAMIGRRDGNRPIVGAQGRAA